MNQENINKFISKERKNKELTQKELADKLNISEKTVSKWECGKGLPEVSLMQPLCKELDISVNELLNGEKNNKKNKEDICIEYMDYAQKKNKKKLVCIITMFSIILLLLLMSTYFLNNYGKTTIYELHGHSANFSYSDAILVKSNQKNLLNTGKIIITNKNINDTDIKSVELMYEKETIYGFGCQNLSSSNGILLQEPNGYDELFTKEKLNNINKWEIIIIYEIDGTKKEEIIEVKNEIIFQNNKLFSLEQEPISTSQNKKEDILEEEQKTKERIIKNLVKEKFETTDDRLYKKELSKEEYISYDIELNILSYSYKEDEDNYIHISNYLFSPNTQVQNESFGVHGYREGKEYNYTYFVKSEKIRYNNNSIKISDAWQIAKNYTSLYKEYQNKLYK